MASTYSATLPVNREKNILIIEDDPDLQFFLRKRLEHRGFKCFSLDKAEMALEHLREIKPHLVILDLGLAQADGTAFLKHVHEWVPPGGVVPPVVVLSAHNQKEIVNYCLEHGAKGFVRKPLDPEVLLRMVHEYIM